MLTLILSWEMRRGLRSACTRFGAAAFQSGLRSFAMSTSS
jgi:hypothetical protein